jgi:hypothetical protein
LVIKQLLNTDKSEQEYIIHEIEWAKFEPIFLSLYYPLPRPKSHPTLPRRFAAGIGLRIVCLAFIYAVSVVRAPLHPSEMIWHSVQVLANDCGLQKPFSSESSFVLSVHFPVSLFHSCSILDDRLLLFLAIQ